MSPNDFMRDSVDMLGPILVVAHKDKDELGIRIVLRQHTKGFSKTVFRKTIVGEAVRMHAIEHANFLTHRG